MNDNELPILSDDIIEKLTRELGLAELSPEECTQILDQLGENIIQRILVATLEKLPEKAQEEFSVAFEKRDFAAMQRIAEPYVGNMDTFVLAETADEIAQTKETFRKSV